MAVMTETEVLLNYQAIPAAITEGQRVLLIGPDVVKRSPSSASLKASLSLGAYSGSQIQTSWPLLATSETVDLATVEVTVADAALRYYNESTRPIADSGAILAGQTNRLRFSDRVLKTANGSTRASQIPVDVEVGDWVRVTNSLAEGVTARVIALIADVVAASVGTATAASGNVGTPTVASGGSYTGTVDTTYIVRVTTGGATNGSTAQVSVTTSTGVDVSGPHYVTTAVAIPIGTKGVTVTLTGATLTANDTWTIAATAAKGGTDETGGAIRTMVLDTPLESTSALVAANWTGTNITAEFAIYGDVTVNRGKTGLAPAVNWIAAASTITLSATMIMRSTRTGTLDLNVVAGTAYVGYRAIRGTNANKIFKVTQASDLTTLGMDYTDVDNTLAYTANLCFDSIGSREILILPVQSDDLAGYVAARATYVERPDFSTICPLTADADIISECIDQSTTRSNSEYRMWTDVIVHQPYSLLQTVVKYRADGSTISSATVTDNPLVAGTQYTLVTDTNGQFITKGVRAGDVVRTEYSSDGFGNETYNSYVVESVTSEQQLVLASALTAAVPVASRYEIWRTLTPTVALANAGAAAAAYADPNVVPVFGDATIDGVTLDNFMVAAYVAAVRSTAAPHQGLVTTQLSKLSTCPSSAVFVGLYAQARQYGMYVLRQLYTGEVVIDSAYTSAITDSELKFDSVNRNLNSQLADMARIFDKYRGRANNVEDTRAKLATDFRNGISYLQTSTKVSALGAMLTSGALTSLTSNVAQADKLDVSFRLTIPAPVNSADFNIDLTVG